MLDWKRIVHEKLAPLPLEAARESEIVEELAQQLEAAYQEELARGASHAEAAHRSLQQFQDWEKLRRDLFESVAGSMLPAWEQKGIVSLRRLPVWIALAVALAFLVLPAFRKALHILPFSGIPGAWSSTTFSKKNLARLERSGDRRRYARTLAYVALHSPDDHEAAQAAEKAIALDPQLTWICAKVSHANYLFPGYSPKPWIDQLRVWDPDNGYVYLLQAGAAVHSDWEARWAGFSPLNSDLRKALMADPRWRTAMEKAFSVPRWDIYVDSQFALDRQVLMENGQDRPDKLMMSSASLQLPDFNFVQWYADHLLLDVASKEQKAGHSANALAAYGQVASFAKKLSAGPTDIEQLYSVRLAKESYERMIPLLRSEGRNLESDSAAFALAATQARDPIYRNKLGWKETPAFRAGQIAFVSAFVLFLFALAALVWLLCAAILRASPNFSRAMNWTASHLGWAVILLPLPCLTLYLSYFPYATSIASYSGPEMLFSTCGSFFGGAQFFRLAPNVWIENMFWPLVWCAAIAILGAIFLFWSRSRHHAGPSEVE